MRRDLIERLSAPGGGEPLSVASIAQEEGEEIIEGAVLSSGQGLYPIRNGLLLMLPRGEGPLTMAQRSNLSQLTAMGYEWPWRTHSLSLLSGESLGFDRERAILFEMLPEPITGLWMDLGASTALYARWFAPRAAADGGEIVALDLAIPMLRVGRRRARAEGHDRIGFVQARAEQLPVADGALHGALCGGSLNEFGAEGAPRVLADLARALRPGGAALFMHLLDARGALGRRLQRFFYRGGGVAFWNRRESTRLFERAGLRVSESRDFGVVAFTRVEKPGG